MESFESLSTEMLRSRLNIALTQLLPIFGVTGEEFSRFKIPNVRRTLENDEVPYHNRDIPGYHYIENYFYFPPSENPEYLGYLHIFSWRCITHEMGHYIHSQINPFPKSSAENFIKYGKTLPGHCELNELVANYPTFIWNTYTCNDPFAGSKFLKSQQEIYYKFGPNIFKRLVRMTPEEARLEGIIDFK